MALINTVEEARLESIPAVMMNYGIVVNVEVCSLIKNLRMFRRSLLPPSSRYEE